MDEGFIPRHADGRALVSWIESQVEWRQSRCRLTEIHVVRMRRWRLGRQASIDKVDEVLTALEIPMSWVPDEIWCRYDNGRRREAA
jgi:hypothetical protein